MNVDQLITDLIKREGGYVNNKNDSGGATKYGITQATLATSLHHDVTIEDVKNLTQSQAAVIYKNLYYYGPRYNSLPEPLQPIVFDFGVNAGVGVATRSLQTVLNMFNYKCDTDGFMDEETIKLATTAYTTKQGYLVNAYVEYRIWWYQRLVNSHPKDQEFLNGWINRANSFRVEVS